MVFSRNSDEGLNGFARLFMNTENRDFVIERLERQLKEKEAELDDIKTNLRESILREIRSDLKNDLDFNNRIAQLERKVQSISSNLNGIMDELLDQKSMIRSLKELSVSKERKVEPKATPNLTQDLMPNTVPKVEKPVSEAAPAEYSSPRVYRPEPKPVSASSSASQSKSVSPSSMVPPSNPSVPKEPASYASHSNPKFSIRSAEPESVSRQSPTAQSSNMRFNVREVPSVKQPEMPEPEPRSEYIIAETDDERQMRLNRTSRQERDSCNYIVAEEDGPASCNDDNEDSDYESVEAREDEDAVIMTTTRRK
jgi:hypothetical protein